MRWVPVREPASKVGKRKVLGKVLEVALRAPFKNHIYTYKNELFRQKRGGAIGLRLTGIVARIVMDRWSRMFLERLGQAEIDVHLLKKYVNDVNLCLAILEEGWYWERRGNQLPELVWTRERQEEDRQEALSKEEHTLLRVQEMANMMLEGIRFTVDFQPTTRPGRFPCWIWQSGRRRGMGSRPYVIHSTRNQPLALWSSMAEVPVQLSRRSPFWEKR